MADGTNAVAADSSAADWQNTFFDTMSKMAVTAVDNMTKSNQQQQKPVTTSLFANMTWQKWAMIGAAVLVVILIIKKVSN